MGRTAEMGCPFGERAEGLPGPLVAWSADPAPANQSAQGAGPEEDRDEEPAPSDLGMTEEELEELLGPIAL